jgi:hypothetical protein
LELTVMTLPWTAENDAQQTLMNVNRWRDQMQLEPIRAADLPKETRSLKLAEVDTKSEATLVDLKGKLKASSMTPPFAGKAGSGELPTGHPPIASAAGGKSTAPPSSDAAKSAAASTPAQTAPSVAGSDADLPLSFAAPQGWQRAKKPPMFAMLAFRANADEKPVDISISQMGAAGGGLLPNVNRWRGQVGLPPVGNDELASVVNPLKVDGLDARMVRFVSPEGADDRKTIMAAIVPQGEFTWFIKMIGPPEAVEHEQANFEKFIDSVKFRGEH